MQQHMQAVGQCQAHAKTKGGDITSNCADMLASQKKISGNDTLLEKDQQQRHST